MPEKPLHIPVLLSTVLDVLQPQIGESVLDVTLGLGGHAEAFLEKIGDSGHLTGLDADMANLQLARERLSRFGDRVSFVHANFGQLPELGLDAFDIVFADLGVSSPHFDDPERGFSFRFDGPLDLRYDRTQGPTAADVIHASDEESVIRWLKEYGELWKEGKRIGQEIAGKRLETTTELRLVIEKLFGFRAKRILPQVFQALRIVVNDEMGVLRTLLDEGLLLLKPGGRMGVLSYHSLEDRMVKQTFKAICEPQKDEVTGRITVEAPFEPIIKGAIQADDAEQEKNPRSRSVRFRAVRKRS